MNTQVIIYLESQQNYYEERSEDPVYRAMRDIINSFRNARTGEFDNDTLQYGTFRSLEDNFVRFTGYHRLTDVDLSDYGTDLEVAKHLVKLYREVGNINRQED